MRIVFAALAAMPLASARLVGWKKEVSRPDLLAFKKEVKTRIQLNFSERPNEEQLAKLRAAIVAEMGVSESELVSFTVQERVKGEHDAAIVSIPKSAEAKNLERIAAQGSEPGRRAVAKEEVAASLQGSPEEDAAVKAALDDPAVTESLNNAGLPPGISPAQAAEWAAKNPEAMAAASETLQDPAVQAAMTSGNPIAIAQAVAAHPEAAQCLAMALLTAVKENPMLVAQLAQQGGVSASSLPASVPNFGGGWQKEAGGKSGAEDAAVKVALDDPAVTASLNKAGLPPGISPVQAVEWAAENPEAMASASEALEDPEVRAAMTSQDPVRIANAVAAHPEAAQCLALALVKAVKENPALVTQVAQQSGVSASSLPASVPNFGGGWQKEAGSKSGPAGASKESFYLDEVFDSADSNGDKLLSKSEALAAAQLLGLSEDDVEAKFAALSPEQVRNSPCLSR